MYRRKLSQIGGGPRLEAVGYDVLYVVSQRRGVGETHVNFVSS